VILTLLFTLLLFDVASLKKTPSMHKASAAQLLTEFGDGEEHEAVITGSKLGMTVENVLERTVVHDVEPDGPAVSSF